MKSATYNLKSGAAYLGDLVDGYQAGTIPPGVDPDYIYYVNNNGLSGVLGSDSYSGKSWEDPFLTIGAARTAANARINWSYTPLLYACIFVAPGVYPELVSFPYYCYIIGTGVQGTDTAAEIHPTTGSCMSGTMLGTILYNLWFETNEAVDCLNVGVCNNSEVAGCTFANGAAVAATALSTDNCTHLHFHHNSVETGQTTGMNYGLYFQGGADKYAHNVRIYDNVFFCTTSAIWIQNTCTASQALAVHNFMGGGTKPIDDNQGGLYCFENYISGTDAIEHAGGATFTVGNHVANAGTGAMEVSGS